MNKSTHEWKSILAFGIMLFLTAIGIGGCVYLVGLSPSTPLIQITTGGAK